MDHYPKVNEGYAKVFTHDVKPVSFPLDKVGVLTIDR